MGKLIFLCGNADKINLENVEVLGSLMSTPAQMSQIGRSLRAPDEGNRVVFSNNDNVLNGLRVAAANGEIDHTTIEIRFYDDRKIINGHHTIRIDKNGRTDAWPNGFFDQIENDLMQLI